MKAAFSMCWFSQKTHGPGSSTSGRRTTACDFKKFLLGEPIDLSQKVTEDYNFLSLKIKIVTGSNDFKSLKLSRFLGLKEKFTVFLHDHQSGLHYTSHSGCHPFI